MTASFSITEIVTESDLNIESFTLTPEPPLLTLKDISACCANPNVLDCNYNNTTFGSGWATSPDFSYQSCTGDEVHNRMVTSQIPDPAWT